MSNAQWLPIGSGLLVLGSILLAGVDRGNRYFGRYRTAAWVSGLGAQAVLIVFGTLTGMLAFWAYLLPATGFVVNLLRGRRPATKRPARAKIVDDRGWRG
jgi:hypothetical protein